MNKSYKFKGILTRSGWLENIIITVDQSGIILSINNTKTETTENVNGYAFPGFQNAHSHAFQYAMAGLAEWHSPTINPDDFWSWRNAMYQVALQISPDDLENIATMLYAEMLRHGYTAVAEFHYLHHDKNGMPYNNLAEMGERLVAAAQKAGIKITLVPMFYQQGGFGKPAEEKQKRFISKTIDDYNLLLEHSKKACTHYTNANLGMGIHSLRAVKEEDILSVCRNYNHDIPFHIHVAEQLKEIDNCLSFYGKRPVEWLLNNIDLNENYHLVHATHLNDFEVKGIAQAKANVVLCPTTEGNLGDGLFRFNDYKKHNGNWSIGTDSHISISPLEELRLLDYGQRLTSHQRNTFSQKENGDSGFNAIEMAWETGRKAMGEKDSGFFEVGKPFDAVILNANSPLIATSSMQHLCNTFIYSCDVSNILGTIINGKWIVKSGFHKEKESITTNFIKTMETLKVRG